MLASGDCSEGEDAATLMSILESGSEDATILMSILARESEL